MGVFMKTTIELPDELLLQAKRAAVDRRTTLKALVLSGLRHELALSEPRVSHPILEIASIRGSDWQSIDANNYVEQERNGWE